MTFVPFTHPVWSTACSFILAGFVVVMTDRFALPPAARAKARAVAGGNPYVDLAARTALMLPVFLLFFAISWRPLYAFAGTVSFFVIFTGISRLKFNDIREPLIFSDLALVVLLFAHRELFRATWLGVGAVVLALVYIFGASALFYIYEPAVLPDHGWPGLVAAGLVLAALPWLLPVLHAPRAALARLAGRIVGADAIAPLTVRLGTFAAVVYGFLVWLGYRPRPSAAHPGPIAVGRGPQPLLIVWQSESFVDMRRHGVSVSLPNLDALRRRSVAWGRMASVFEGGYTLRTEFAVLSGLAPAEIGPDASYPYLRAHAYSGITWPDRLRQAGWATRFVHPYEAGFFLRDRALPKLGFEALTMLDAFDHDASRDGPYVSDLTLSRRVLEFCGGDGDDQGRFLFVASMENHGPWSPGRDGDKVDALDIYVGLLERSDQALGYLVEELDRLERPVWLVFYGDHAPLLKSFADPFPDPNTDYVIVPLGGAARAQGPAQGQDKAPWDLIATTVSHMENMDAAARPD